MLLYSLCMIVCGLSAVSAQRVLALPDPKSCAKRKFLEEMHLVFLVYSILNKFFH